MKMFNRFLNEQVLPSVAWLEVIHRHQILTPSRDDVGGQPRMKMYNDKYALTGTGHLTPAGFSPDHWEAGDRQLRTDISSACSSWVMAGMVGEGPKVYAPDARECEALSHIALHVPWADYRQPFETLVVALPDDYTFPLPPHPEIGRPSAVVSRYDHPTGAWVVCVTGQSRKSLTSAAIMDDARDLEFEIDGEGHLTDGDNAVLAEGRRIVANAALILSKAGARRLGKANPAYAAKLEAGAAKRGLSAAARAQNERALRLLPDVYGFEQTITVYDEERPAGPEPVGQGGYAVKPHWRRGYWMRQPCGEGRRERVLQFRRPVLVNAHRLAGPLSNTHVTLTRG